MARERTRRPDRGLAPVVGKTLEIGLVLLFIAGLSTALFGGVVPDYRTAVGDEVAERTAVAAAERVDAAVPPTARSARVERRVPLPDTIRGAAYRVAVEDRLLVLEHPARGIGATARLAFPSRVVSVGGTWHSGADTTVVVTTAADGLRVELVNG